MGEIIIIVSLILLNGIFAMSEIAVISARKSSLQTDANKGSKSARKALRLQENPDKFLSSVQIGITLVGLLTGMFSGNKIADLFAELLVSLGVDSSISVAIAQTVIILIVTYLSIVIGELVPKRIGMNSAEKVAKIISGPMSFVSKIATPIVWILSKSTSGIVSIFGLKNQENKITEEEIKSIIQEGADEGEVLPMEQSIVGRVFTLGDLRVNSIMTLRSDIVHLEKDMTKDEIRTIIAQDMYEEYPVVDGDLDHVIGVFRLKDFVLNIENSDFSLENMLIEPIYYYENMNVYKVLEDMRLKKISRALICDEFGSCSGIITYKDILEALIGNVDDEDSCDLDIVERSEGESWLVDGQCTMYDFLNHFGLDAEMQDYDYTTIAGLVLHTLEHIPRTGDCAEWGEFLLEVVDMDGPRIDKILVKKREYQSE